ncbi:hypothetical protein [Pseudomonas syringae]|nr:hypothetical protein [Pseudomonas syringae]
MSDVGTSGAYSPLLMAGFGFVGAAVGFPVHSGLISSVAGVVVGFCYNTRRTALCLGDFFGTPHEGVDPKCRPVLLVHWLVPPMVFFSLHAHRRVSHHGLVQLLATHQVACMVCRPRDVASPAAIQRLRGRRLSLSRPLVGCVEVVTSDCVKSGSLSVWRCDEGNNTIANWTGQDFLIRKRINFFQVEKKPAMRACNWMLRSYF